MVGKNLENFKVLVLENRLWAYCPHWLTKLHIPKEKIICRKKIERVIENKVSTGLE